ncbi:MAG: metal ABC transporter ATP-binding protein [Bacteroidota bacterium]
MKAISIKGLSVSYDKKTVLSNIYLDVEPGKLYGVLGPNGAGKSTLFKAILGLIPVSSGLIEVFGEPIQSVRKRVVYIPQKGEIDWQFPATVMDVVLMGRYPFKSIFQWINKADKIVAEKALDQMGILGLRDRQIGELSGGQQQRVFLARALCQQADIFFMDEPFVGVDITTEQKIVELLHDLADAGKTVLVVHHDLSKVSAYFDKVILLNNRLIACGETATTFIDENIARTYGGQLDVLHKTQHLKFR